MFEKVVGITPDFPLASEHLLKVRRGPASAGICHCLYPQYPYYAILPPTHPSRPLYGGGAGPSMPHSPLGLQRATHHIPSNRIAVLLCFALRSFGRSAARTNPYQNGGFDLLCNGIGSGGRTALAEQRPYRWHC